MIKLIVSIIIAVLALIVLIETVNRILEINFTIFHHKLKVILQMFSLRLNLGMLGCP